MATNSLLLRFGNPSVKSLSFVSGALSTYRKTSCPENFSRYSCSQTAQFLEVEILSPSKLRNSFAGTFSEEYILFRL